MGCLLKAPVKVLTRFGVGPDQRLEIGRPASGRGAWIHAGSLACFDLAVKRHAFQRALRIEVGEGELNELRVRLGKGAEQGEGVGG